MNITKSIKDIINKTIIIMGIIMFFSVMIQKVRIIIGQSVNIIMDPIIRIIGKSNFYIVILLIALITALYSSIIQKYTINQNKIEHFQKKTKELKKQMDYAKKIGNQAKIKELELNQITLMKDQTSIMKEQMIPMFYIIIFSLPIFMWIYYYININSGIYMCFPIWGDQLLSDSVFYTFQYWIYWYFIVSISSGQIIKKIINNRL